MSLLICQVTGSFLLTDSSFRWKEIIATQKDVDNINNSWNAAANCISELEYPLNLNPEISFSLRRSGKAGKLRSILRDLYSNIQNSTSGNLSSFKNRYIDACLSLKKEGLFNQEYGFLSEWQCIIPKDGIKHNNVQRIILLCGIEDSLQQVPMAIFMDFSKDVATNNR